MEAPPNVKSPVKPAFKRVKLGMQKQQSLKVDDLQRKIDQTKKRQIVGSLEDFRSVIQKKIDDINRRTRLRAGFKKA